MKDHIKFRLFLVIIFVFIGAVIFISDPLANKSSGTTANHTIVSTVSTDTDGNTVNIEEEDTALGVPANDGTSSRWIWIAVAVTVINLAGTISIVFMTNRDTKQI